MTELAITVSVILLPGLTATLISDYLVVHTRPWSSFRYGVYSFVFGVGSYLSLQILVFPFSWVDWSFSFLPSLSGELDIWSAVNSSKKKIELQEVIAATFISIFLALLVVLIVNRKYLNKFAQSVGLSNKFGDENLFSYFLNLEELDWVYIRDFGNKLTYQGRIKAIAENDGFQEIVLCDVTIYGYDDSNEYYSIPSIYLSKKIGEFVIEQVNPENLGADNDKKTC